MKRRNGSIILATLFCCIILSTICLGCIELVKTNSYIILAKEKSIKMKYEVKSGISLAFSKLLEEINNLNLNKANNEKLENNIKEKFLGTNKINVIRNIESVSDNKLKVSVINNDIYLEDNFIKFDIESKKEDGNFKKIAMCSVKISLNENDKNRIYRYNYKEF